MNGQPIYFNPYAEGLEVFLGPSEARVMELCWERGTMTVKKALFYWTKEPKPAYTTLMTVMARLADKKLLDRKKKGRFFEYTPALTRDNFVRERVSLVASCLEKQFPSEDKKKSRK
jgi:predicted transcriptional regulator